MHPDLRLALELADLADSLSLPRFRANDLRVSAKPDLTPVSEVDTAVEAAIRRRLRHHRPGDAILGEEEGGAERASRRWILDPIDGTRNFVRGVPVWATLLALEVEGEVVVGVVSAPALRRRWWAARGEGAHADGRRLHVSAVAAVEDAYASTTDPTDLVDDPRLHPRVSHLLRRFWTVRALGDFWSHVLVAEGAIDVALERPVEVWDLAASRVIVEEAGGRFSDLEGRPRLDGGSALFTNGLLHDRVLAALGCSPSPEAAGDA